MALSAIALSSRALLKLGAAGIASFEEGTAESDEALDDPRSDRARRVRRRFERGDDARP